MNGGARLQQVEIDAILRRPEVIARLHELGFRYRRPTWRTLCLVDGITTMYEGKRPANVDPLSLACSRCGGALIVEDEP